MAITSGFFNSVNGDRRYNAAQIGEYLQYIVGSGVFPYVSTSLQVLATDGMTVEVQAGRAMLDHHYMDNDAPITLTLNAGGSQDRIDGIIMYVDMTERACGITIKEGTPAAAPVRPAMTRTDVRKEYMLAAIRIPKLSTAITQSSITDTRPDSTVCGWVSGLIDQVDTATLFDQWQTAYEEAYAELGDYLAAQKAAWDAFFTAVAEDNLVPVPNVDAIGNVISVNDTGDGYVLKPTDITLTVPGAVADAAAVGRALTVPNLLDNSDFTDPVNETGFKGGAPSADNVYFIDKWKTQQNITKNVEVNFSDSGLIIRVSTGLAGIAQVIRKPKTGVTLAAKVNGKIEFVYARHDVDESTKTAENVLLYVEWLEDTLQVIIRNTGEEANEYTVEWAALYEGEFTAETLPVYRPRGYAIEAVICGGGGGLNFKVVGGTTQPTNPTENTIWVNTSTTISSYVFAAEAPSNPAAGMVWIYTGAESAAEFNALKNNILQVYPISAKQYISGAWVGKIAKSYQGGKWVDLTSYVFNNGVIYKGGSWNATVSGNYLTQTMTVPTNGTRKIYTNKEAVNVSGYTQAIFVVQSSSPVYSNTEVGIYSQASNGGNITPIAYFDIPDYTANTDTQMIVSIPSGTTNCYFGFGIYRNSSSSGATTTLKVKSIMLK